MQIVDNEKKYLSIIEKHIENGVKFYTSHGIVIDDTVIIGKGTLIMPGTILLGDTTIGEDCTIGPNTMIKDSKVGNSTTVNSSQVTSSVVKNSVKIGPFSQIRPNCVIEDDVKLGNFVEVKNSNIKNSSSVSHLTYIGDADIGSYVNVGCGVVTVNYDGQLKKRTTIDDFAFIGCNTNLIAPVKIGESAYTAAGSTITKDVPDNALAIARTRQEIKEDWANRKLSDYRKKYKK